jgi:hypothetical protein
MFQIRMSFYLFATHGYVLLEAEVSLYVIDMHKISGEARAKE